MDGAIPSLHLYAFKARTGATLLVHTLTWAVKDYRKDLEESCRGIIEVSSRNLPGMVNEYVENPQDSRCAVRDSNHAYPEYKALELESTSAVLPPSKSAMLSIGEQSCEWQKQQLVLSVANYSHH
jgi:hypothetical protein